MEINRPPKRSLRREYSRLGDSGGAAGRRLVRGPVRSPARIGGARRPRRAGPPRVDGGRAVVSPRPLPTGRARALGQAGVAAGHARLVDRLGAMAGVMIRFWLSSTLDLAGAEPDAAQEATSRDRWRLFSRAESARAAPPCAPDWVAGSASREGNRHAACELPRRRPSRSACPAWRRCRRREMAARM